MIYKSGLLIFSFFIGSLLFAQNGELKSQLASFEKNTDHKAAITELKKMLVASKLTANENIAVKTVLVHKYQELQQWDTCLAYCQNQIALAHQNKNSFAEASFYKLIANTYYHIPDKEKAVLYWEKTIAISEPNKYNILLEQCYHNIGSIYLERGIQLDIAEKYFLKSLKLGLINNPAASFENAQHYRLLATLYTNTNQLKKAEDLYLDVIERCKALKDTAQLTETLIFYSELLGRKKEYDKAIITSGEALLLSRKLHKLDITLTALDFHAKNLYGAGKYREAYQAKSEADSIIRERFKMDLNSKISDAEVKFKTTEMKHENEIASIKAKKEKQVYITGFAGLLILASFAFYYFYQKRSVRQKVQMQLQVQEEKERLSRDLHDNLGSQMALLSNNVENLDTNYRKHLAVDENIDRVKSTSKQLLQTLRETIWILNKEQVSAQDFFDKLVDYAHRFLQSYPQVKLQVTENFSGNKQLNSNEALQLFRICQEAITNSCKYAESETLELQAKTEHEIFAISIKDSGKGFDARAIFEEGHYGLKNMQKRATEINAGLQILATTGNGVAILIKV